MRFHTKQSRILCESVSNSTRIGMSAVGFSACASKSVCELPGRLVPTLSRALTIQPSIHSLIFMFCGHDRLCSDEPGRRHLSQVALVQLRLLWLSLYSRTWSRVPTARTRVEHRAPHRSTTGQSRSPYRLARASACHKVRVVRVECTRVRKLVAGAGLSVVDHAAASRGARRDGGDGGRREDGLHEEGGARPQARRVGRVECLWRGPEQ